MALLAAYSFDEASGDFLDYSGNGRHWPLNNSAVRTTGHTGAGLTKSGVGLPVVAEPAFGQTPARTFMFWLRGSGTTWWLRWYIAGADTGAWGLYNLSGTLNLRLRKGGANTNTTTAAPADGEWHHFAGTYDGTNARLYIDGALVATSAAVTAPLDSADRIDLAEWTVSSTVMDDLRIYDEALDQATVATLMATPVTAEEPPHAEGTVTLPATAGLSAAGARSASASVGLSAVAGLARTGVRASVGSASLPAVADLELSGARSSAGTVPLEAVGALVPSGTSHRSGVVTLSATASLLADEMMVAPLSGTWATGRAPQSTWSAGRTPVPVWRSGR